MQQLTKKLFEHWKRDPITQLVLERFSELYTQDKENLNYRMIDIVNSDAAADMKLVAIRKRLDQLGFYELMSKLEYEDLGLYEVSDGNSE